MVSLLITTFQRDDLLQLTLPGILKQATTVAQGATDFEVIILNDGTPDNTEQLCSAIAAKHNFKNLRYVFTGQRNLEKVHWRIPGFAFNIGAKLAHGDILILSCAEMFHVNNCIAQLAAPLVSNKWLMTVPVGRNDTNGKYLSELKATGRGCSRIWYQLQDLKVHLPFLMGVDKKTYIDIGGYDEDFIGQAFDDNDLVDRLQLAGCAYYSTLAQTVHLFHSRSAPGRNEDGNARWTFNEKMYKEKKGTIFRNTDREWGALCP